MYRGKEVLWKGAVPSNLLNSLTARPTAILRSCFRHHLLKARRRPHVDGYRHRRREVQCGLLVTFRVLLSPEHPEEVWPVILDIESPRHLGMTGQTKRNHRRGVIVPRLAMVNRDRPLASLQCRTAEHATSVTIALQNFFAMTTKVGFILALKRVAGSTKPLASTFG